MLYSLTFNVCFLAPPLNKNFVSLFCLEENVSLLKTATRFLDGRKRNFMHISFTTGLTLYIGNFFFYCTESSKKVL